MRAMSVFLVVCAVFCLPSGAPAQTAAEVIAATGIPAGFCVHLGCGNGSLTASLNNDARMVVQGLSTKAADVDVARAHIKGQGLYGMVSVGKVGSYALLPYQDNMVNLIVADLGDLGSDAPSQEEILRCLRPGGAAYLGNAGSWDVVRKPWPESMDEWSHFQRNAASNPQSQDSLVDWPRGVQWFVAGQRNNGTSNVVLAGGRWFHGYSLDPTSYTYTGSRRVNYVAGRDAFNGVLLWRREERVVPRASVSWSPNLCADSLRLYGSLVDTGAGRALDAATGADVALYADGARTTGKLTCTPSGFYGDHGLKAKVPIHVRYGDWLIQAYELEVNIFDAATGALYWKYTETDPASAMTAYVAVGGNRVFVAMADANQCGWGSNQYQNRFAVISSVVALDLDTRSVAWRDQSCAGFWIYNLLYHDNGIYMVSRDATTVTAACRIDATTGQTVWRTTYTTGTSPIEGKADAATNTRIWNGRLVTTGYKSIWGFDIATGQVEQILKVDKTTPWNADVNVCGISRGTAYGQLSGVFGFVDLRTKGLSSPTITRSTCNQSYFPAYGLVYNDMTGGCTCYPFLRGHVAYRCSTTTDWREAMVPDAQRLETGSAAAPAVPATTWPGAGEWPMMAADPRRSFYSQEPVAADLDLVYRVTLPVVYPNGPAAIESRENPDICGAITPPVIGEGRLLAASSDQHTLFCLDTSASASAPLWSFTTGGRIDSPPTIYNGTCLFGCRDGYVYCVRMSDGALIWRFFAAFARRSIMVNSQPECLWPLVGTVMIHEGKAYVSAGRHNQADHIAVWRLDPATGTAEARAVVTAGPSSTDSLTRRLGKFGEWKGGTLNDGMVTNARGDVLYIGTIGLDPRSLAWVNLQLAYDASLSGPVFPGLSYTIESEELRSYMRNWGFGMVDRRNDGPNIGQWFYRTNGYHYGNKFFTTGSIWGERLVRTPLAVYSIRRSLLVRYDLNADGVGTPDGRSDTLGGTVLDTLDRYAWLYSLAGAGEKLFATLRTTTGAYALWQIDTHTGEVVRKSLEAEPVTNGIAVAGGRVYVALENGAIQGYGSGSVVSVRGGGNYQEPSVSSTRAATLARPSAALYTGQGLTSPQATPAQHSAARIGSPRAKAPAEEHPTQAAVEVSETPEAAVTCATFDKLTGEGRPLGLLKARGDYPEYPRLVTQTDSFDWADDGHGCNGVRMSAVLAIRETGWYRFWLSSTEEAQLSLSPTSSFDSLSVVARVDSLTAPGAFTRKPSQQSEPVYLQRGMRCAIEAVGASVRHPLHLSVAWQGPSWSREVISGTDCLGTGDQQFSSGQWQENDVQ